MTLNEITYDIITILTKAGYTNDSRLEEGYIEYLIAKKRESEIMKTFNEVGYIDSIYFQDLGIFDVSIIDPSQDRSIAVCNCVVGKVTLPPIIPLFDDIAMQSYYSIRVSSVCNSHRYYPIPFDLYSEIPANHTRRKMKQFFKIANAFYLAPAPEKARFITVLSDPLKGFVLQTENISYTGLIVGESYIVVEGQAIHNSIPYSKGSSFIAVNSLWTGTTSTIVRFVNEKRQMTIYDEYPIDGMMANAIVIKILTEEYKIESGQIADIVQDSRDQLQMMK